MRKTFCLVAVFLITLSPLTVRAAGAANYPPAPIVISEIQTGGCAADTAVTCTEDPKVEFIELRNQTAANLLLQNWQLQYISASGKTITTIIALNGSIAAGGYVLLAHDGYYGEDTDLVIGTDDTKSSGLLAKTGGSVQLLDSSGNVVDLAGWGSADVAETKAAKAPDPGQSLQRLADDEGVLIDTSDNSLDFTVASPATPQGGGFTPADDSSDDGSVTAPPSLTCEGVVINEILPNPTGTDGGHEYIELYNPTDEPIPLDGCSLQTTANSKTYDFKGVTLGPGQYQAFYDSETGLTLANAAGGTVWLLSPTEEIQSINYPGGLDDNQAWSLFGGNWQATYSLTPSGANLLVSAKSCPAGQYRSTVTNRCRNIESASTLSSCGTNQYRNPVTNRCKTLVLSVSSLAPCAAGQYRNPATNRCKSAVSSSSSLTPCQSNQFRNPETNRCKLISSSGSSLKPCQPGWTRNPETNRCRKGGVVKGASIATVKDVNTPSVGTSPRWILAGLLILVALAYAIYEWRQEISLKYVEAKAKAAKLNPLSRSNSKSSKG